VPGAPSWSCLRPGARVRLSAGPLGALHPYDDGVRTIPVLTHVHADVLDPASLDSALAGLDISHLFFATWQRQATEAENCAVNGSVVVPC
jgi:hypothetical protein